MGPPRELIQAIIALKQRNPRFGCRRIAQQIAKTFEIVIDKDQVRRVLAEYYRPGSDDNGPSWLTFLGHTKGPRRNNYICFIVNVSLIIGPH